MNGTEKDMKELNETRLRILYDYTNKCYYNACRTVGYTIESLQQAYNESTITKQEALFKKEELDKVYRELLCKLPSKVIEDIIKANTLGLQKRARTTIDVLITELLQRTIENEGKQKNSSNS